MKSRSWEPLIAGTIRLWEPSLRSTSTAMPRLTGAASIACGWPSRSSKVRTITGKSLTAWTIAQATRWVKETLRPRSFSTALIALRLASSVSTAIVRNEVAVGTARLSSIALASIAAGPRSRFGSPAAAAGAAAAPLPEPAASTSLLGHLAVLARALDRAEVDALRSSHPARDRRGPDVGAVAGGPCRGWRRGRRSARSPRGRSGVPGDRTRGLTARSRARFQLGQGRADGDFVVHRDQKLGDDAGGGGRHLGVDLVGRHLHHGVALADRVALRDMPLEDHAGGDGLAHLGHRDDNRLARTLGSFTVHGAARRTTRSFASAAVAGGVCRRGPSRGWRG